jgi:hypothetical protein
MNTLPPAREVSRFLFGSEPHRILAVLDGASVPGLAQAMQAYKVEHECLYRGELGADLVATAPYVARCEPEHPFTEWLLNEGWGRHWGIFAALPRGLAMREIRKHFRTFLMVKDPEGRTLYFRYYDPRVMRVYLPSCNATEMKTVFGPALSYIMEDEGGQVLVRIVPGGSKPKVEKIELARTLAV